MYNTTDFKGNVTVVCPLFLFPCEP